MCVGVGVGVCVGVCVCVNVCVRAYVRAREGGRYRQQREFEGERIILPESRKCNRLAQPRSCTRPVEPVEHSEGEEDCFTCWCSATRALGARV